MPMLRRCIGVLVVLCLGAASGRLSAQQITSLDPSLRALLRPGIRSAVQHEITPQAAGSPRTTSLHFDLEVVPDAAGQPEVGVFLQLRDAAGLNALRRAGAQIRAVVGGMVAARVPLSALPGLTASGEFRRIEAAHRIKVVDDSSTLAMDAQRVREVVGNGEWIGFTGRGTIVGDVDTGIDFRHQDFIDPNGHDRVIGVWDQTLNSGQPPPGFSYGVYCDSTTIQASLSGSGCAEVDRAGHGTHVMGIAAGDGSATASGTSNYLYAGVAPEADILMAKAGDNSFFESDIIAGLQWIKQTAQALGRPAVANLSLGGQSGPHDGSRLYEMMIDSLSGPGFMVAVAAGNDGANKNTTPAVTLPDIHAAGVAQAGTVGTFTLVIPSYTPSSNPCNDYAVLDLWSSPQDQLSVTVRRPDQTSLTIASGDTANQVSANGNIFVDNSSLGPDPLNDENETYIELSGCVGSGSPQPGDWTVQLTPGPAPSGERYDMWLFGSSLGIAGDVAMGGAGFDNRSTVSSPGTAKRAITVGAFVSRLCFPSLNGTLCTTLSQQHGDIAYFSGSGPTRDGRLKPEIAAPGRFVISALSSNASFSSQYITPDQRHVVMQGTSMATPHVTGAIALMLELDPHLTPEDAKAVFARTDAHDAFTVRSYVDADPGGTPNYDWGYGKLDLQAALTDLGAARNAATLSVTATPLSAPDSASSRSGTRLPLLLLDLADRGSEPTDIRQLGFAVTGSDPQASVALIRDANGNGVLDDSDPVISSSAVAVSGTDSVLVQSDSLEVASNSDLRLIVALVMGGSAPNGGQFSMTYLPAFLRSVGEASHVAWLVDQPATTVASEPVRTTVLNPGEVFTMSENPIRSDRVVFDFSTKPDMAVIYTLSGRRVVDIGQRLNSAYRAEWDVTNDSGVRVAPGIYLLVVEVAGHRITKKLFVTGEHSSGGGANP
jgi:subtilisin family serine protease